MDPVHRLERHSSSAGWNQRCPWTEGVQKCAEFVAESCYARYQISPVEKGSGMSLARTSLATTFVVTFIATAPHAQSLALTNTDVTRLMMMRVSDKTVIVVINE